MIRLPVRRVVLFLALLVLALIALFPMRIMLGATGLGSAGLSVREVRGSIWSARLAEARFGSAELGDMKARLNLFPLLVGRARIDLDRAETGGSSSLKGAVSVTRHSIGVDDVTARLPVARLFAPMPVAALDLSDVSIRFRQGACDRADGLVRAEIQGDVPGLALANGLSGTARCDGDAVLLPLASQSGMERLSLRIGKSGGYTADFVVRGADPAASRALEANGFAASADGLKLSVAGTL